MIILKSFFRRANIKIYLAIFSVLFTSLIILFSFTDYYTKLANEIFQENTYFLVISTSDQYNLLDSNQNIIELEKAILFNPDLNYNILNSNVDNIEKIIWNDLLVNEDFIWVFSNDKHQLNLTENELAIGLPSNILEFKNSLGLIKEPIGFYHGTQNIKFEIKNFYESNFPEILISHIIFEEIYQNSELYAYRVKIKDYRKSSTVENKFKQYRNIEFASIYERYGDSKDSNNLMGLKDLISILIALSYACAFVFSIIFIIITKNIIADEYIFINLERLLGYSKKQIKINLLVKFFFLITAAFFITIVFSFIFINIVNHYLKITLVPLNFNLLLTLYAIILLIILIFVVFFKVKEIAINIE